MFRDSMALALCSFSSLILGRKGTVGKTGKETHGFVSQI